VDLSLFIRYRTTTAPIFQQAFSRFPVDDTTYTLQGILTKFLKGSGIPCPQLFDQAKVHFSDLVNLEQIDEPSYRSKMFCWAATGCPSLIADSGDITVGCSAMAYALY
jgi:hypothetical protein